MTMMEMKMMMVMSASVLEHRAAPAGGGIGRRFGRPPRPLERLVTLAAVAAAAAATTLTRAALAAAAAAAASHGLMAGGR